MQGCNLAYIRNLDARLWNLTQIHIFPNITARLQKLPARMRLQMQGCKSCFCNVAQGCEGCFARLRRLFFVRLQSKVLFSQGTLWLLLILINLHYMKMAFFLVYRWHYSRRQQHRKQTRLAIDWYVYVVKWGKGVHSTFSWVWVCGVKQWKWGLTNKKENKTKANKQIQNPSPVEGFAHCGLIVHKLFQLSSLILYGIFLCMIMTFSKHRPATIILCFLDVFDIDKYIHQVCMLSKLCTFVSNACTCKMQWLQNAKLCIEIIMLSLQVCSSVVFPHEGCNFSWGGHCHWSMFITCNTGFQKHATQRIFHSQFKTSTP